MSVFTPVSRPQLQNWLSHYAVGELEAFEGISAGVQNTNYFVDTSLGRYVLTLFEGFSRAELPYYLYLMAHHARHGLPVPSPIASCDDEYLMSLNGRPAVLVARVPGTLADTPGPAHCMRLGTMLAGLHLAGLSYGRRQPNPRGVAWRCTAALELRPHLPDADQRLLDDELRAQSQLGPDGLPAGAIHGDLFRDNVLWCDERIGGVIDFYFAGSDALLYDLAVTFNDWCLDPGFVINRARARALIGAYARSRPLCDAERAAWPLMVRSAALRFWLSRGLDRLKVHQSAQVLVKNPDEYRDLLCMLRENTAYLADLLLS